MGTSRSEIDGTTTHVAKMEPQEPPPGLKDYRQGKDGVWYPKESRAERTAREIREAKREQWRARAIVSAGVLVFVAFHWILGWLAD